jgi:hypothetical protein
MYSIASLPELRVMPLFKGLIMNRLLEVIRDQLLLACFAVLVSSLIGDLIKISLERLLNTTEGGDNYG